MHDEWSGTRNDKVFWLETLCFVFKSVLQDLWKKKLWRQKAWVKVMSIVVDVNRVSDVTQDENVYERLKKVAQDGDIERLYCTGWTLKIQIF